MGPGQIRHSSHEFATQSSHSVDLAGRQAKIASIEIWIPCHNVHKPHPFPAKSGRLILEDVSSCGLFLSSRQHACLSVCLSVSLSLRLFHSCVCVLHKEEHSATDLLAQSRAFHLAQSRVKIPFLVLARNSQPRKNPMKFFNMSCL